ncbi:hypothetical protein GL50803_00113871 [Giardia duodenalis]|uniref:Uncharacterized protein n=1 Tax=Giardia intestinalis (strain ATCC 50803 / WB clone C6) TaxID=184922 RepID=A8B6D7_GIAIC|nr:hypothetical protein GL50803_00113871 [Giardia intestinalis]KAE8304985.1 hypothetical protein GL50803_00113871 [Giardia intestinalis]|eukprot:XP_001709447.1 Hypothetical protein GL50803_113871 [Giardia lamblia ATCC 50803]
MSQHTARAFSATLASDHEGMPGVSLFMTYSVDKSTLPPSILDNITVHSDENKETELIANSTRLAFTPTLGQWHGSERELSTAAELYFTEIIRTVVAGVTPLTIVVPLLFEKGVMVSSYNPICSLPQVLKVTEATEFAFSAVCFMSGKAYDMHDTISTTSMATPTELSVSVGLTGEVVYNPAPRKISAAVKDCASGTNDFLTEYSKMMTYLLSYVSHNSSISAIAIHVHLDGLPHILVKSVPCRMNISFISPIFRSGDSFWEENLSTDFPADDIERASKRYDLGSMSVLDNLALACYVNYGRLFFSSKSAPDTLPTCAYQQYAAWTLSRIPSLDFHRDQGCSTSESTNTQLITRTDHSNAGGLVDPCSDVLKIWQNAGNSAGKSRDYSYNSTRWRQIDKEFVLKSFSLQDYISTKTLSALAKVLHEHLFLRTSRVLAWVALPSEFLFTKASAIAMFSFVAGIQRGYCVQRPTYLTREAELADRIRYVLNELHTLETMTRKSNPLNQNSESDFESCPSRAVLYSNIPNPEVRKLLEQKDNLIDKLEDCIKALESDNAQLRQDILASNNNKDQPSSFFDSIFVEDSSMLAHEKNDLVNDIDTELKNLMEQHLLNKQQLNDLQKLAAGEGSAQLLEKLQGEVNAANAKIKLLETELRNSQTALYAEQDSCSRLKRETEDLVAQLERAGRLALVTSPTKSTRVGSQLPPVLPQIIVPSAANYTEDDVRSIRQEYENKIYGLKEQRLMDMAAHRAEVDALKKAHADQLESFRQAVKNRYAKERDREYAKMKKQLESDYMLKLKEIKLKVKEAMLGGVNM